MASTTLNDPNTSLKASPINQPPSGPTRVILRLYVQDFDSNGFKWIDYPTAVETYLRWANRSITDYKDKKHSVFVEPFQDVEVNQRRFHIIVDLYALSFEVVNMDNVSHEIYEIRREAGTLRLLQAKTPLFAANLIKRLRTYTDERFWGMEAFEPATEK